MGQTILMGRKTFESIGKTLPGRENFVLSTRKAEENNKCFSSLDEAFKNVPTQNCYIIGGASIFGQTMDKIDGIYLTQIDQDYEGDVFYPEIPSYFKEKSKEKLQENPKIEVIFYENTKKR